LRIFKFRIVTHFIFFAFELGVKRKYYPFQGMSYNPQKYKNLSRGYKKMRIKKNRRRERYSKKNYGVEW